MSKFFQFRQNNSGGGFDSPAINVIIEARDWQDANHLAEDKYGLYFNGVAAGIDCSCCGDRWYDLWSGDEGTDEPCVYSEPVEKASNKS